MINISDDERRRAFCIWLRSGRLPSARSVDGIELKFNPWHDRETGRFTFVGGGRHYGQWSGGEFSGGGGGKGGGGGAAGSWGRPARPSQPKSQDPASRAIPMGSARAASSSRRPASSQSSARGAWTGGAFTGGGGGSFGGGGARATQAWGPPEPKRPPGSSRGSAPATGSSHLSGATSTSSPPPNAQSEQFRTAVRNGYTYQIDTQGRTRHVSGVLTVADAPARSRASQRQAGGAERRASDDGGHYIAARFNGPTEAFNHFAQDANFNRGVYRLLEGEWARDKRAERAVSVKIVPQFSGNSVRPSTIGVWWTVNGERKSLQFRNERSEKRRGEK